ncbi:NADH-ubiquinone oxidoreductase-F iron-sulfur binding region domain-containing protein [Roseomonas elaeocarpi]|uniref:NADH-ubiquinone oxidoreductase-F iron-sulfur binding region domain-containing protein n=1 Tax=Roseomonas elaeocarpi TaxID=907779 RepID=A0ABV6JMB7_9PROT
MIPALSAADPHANGLATGCYPGVTPRLMLPGDLREDLAAYRAAGGYAPIGDGAALIEAVEAAQLRGRGGAAFPMAVKLRSLADQHGEKYLLANGEEGEPASIKDRWLLRRRPHLVLDGVLRAAVAIGASRAILYVSDEAAARSVEAAVAELGETVVPLSLHQVEPAYVAGEETAAVRAVNGGPAKPTDKPPRPFQSGVAGRPTLVANVETLANLPFIATEGAGRFREHGDGTGSPGTFLMTVSGACRRPGLYEVPMGVTLGQALEALTGLQGTPHGFLMGGFFAGLMGPRALEVELSYDRLRAAGSGLGCGAVVVVGPDDCPVSAAADVLAYFARENAGQCGACMRGTPAMSKVADALSRGTATAAEVEKLRGWSVSLIGRGACNLLDGAAFVAASLFREFPDEVDTHLAGRCEACASQMSNPAASRFCIA